MFAELQQNRTISPLYILFFITVDRSCRKTISMALEHSEVTFSSFLTCIFLSIHHAFTVSILCHTFFSNKRTIRNWHQTYFFPCLIETLVLLYNTRGKRDYLTNFRQCLYNLIKTLIMFKVQ